VKGKRVLVAPLDWGLGHATRSIPVVREAMKQDCDVLLAGSGDSLDLLRDEFPALPFVSLPPYAPVYSNSSRLMLKLAQQFRRFQTTIRKEHQRTEEIVKEHAIDLIISDNRYGCWSQGVRSIFICHQVNLLLPSAFSWLSPAVNSLHRSYMGGFDLCWIPDWRGEQSLAGGLSQESKLPAVYIGPLSRFDCPSYEEKTYDLTFILSGPEPQRTLFEKKIIGLVNTSNLRVCLVRGSEEEAKEIANPRITQVGRVNSARIRQIIASSELMVMRPGYSTIMDLQFTGGRVVFVPTPGQPEQEYLANRLEDRGIAGHVDQRTFTIERVLKKSLLYGGFAGAPNDGALLRSALQDALEKGVEDLHIHE